MDRTDSAMPNDARLLTTPENIRAGMKLGPIFYVVSAEQVEKFRAATGFRSHDQDVAPPTMRLQDYALLIAAHFRGGSGGVHAKHRTELFAPMRAGQAIRSEGIITRTWTNRGKFYFELEYESRDASSNQLLVRQAITSVLLRDGKME